MRVGGSAVSFCQAGAAAAGSYMPFPHLHPIHEEGWLVQLCTADRSAVVGRLRCAPYLGAPCRRWHFGVSASAHRRTEAQINAQFGFERSRQGGHPAGFAPSAQGAAFGCITGTTLSLTAASLACLLLNWITWCPQLLLGEGTQPWQGLWARWRCVLHQSARELETRRLFLQSLGLQCNTQVV